MVVLYACARGKLISSVVIVVVAMDMKIAKSQNIGIGQSALSHQNYNGQK